VATCAALALGFAALDHAGNNLAATPAEGADHLRGDALQLRGPLHHRGPAHPEATAQLGAQLGLVQVAGRLGVAVDEAAVQRPPPTLGVTNEVGDEHVVVQQRIAGARGAMLEAGGDESHPAHWHHAAFAPAPTERRLSLQVAQRGAHRRLVAQLDLARYLSLTERKQQRHALRRPEGEVISGQALPSALGASQRLCARWIVAIENGSEVLGPHLAAQSQGACPGPEPLPWRLASVEVIVLDAAGHGLEVILSGVAAQLADVQHEHTGSDEMLAMNTSQGSQGEQVCA
jgi:hypothetical protein